MTPSQTLTAFAAVAMFTAPARAQETPTLESLKFVHEVAVAALGATDKKLDQRYQAQLAKLSEDATTAGDLDQILFIKGEIEAIASGKAGAEIPAAFSSVTRARRIYLAEQRKLETARAEKLRQLRSTHRSKLLALQRALTQRSKIEEAIVIKAEITAIDALLRAGSPSRSAVTPGKLVIFGRFGDSPARVPEEFEDDTFTAVAAGYEHWLALKPDGQVVGRPDGKDYLQVPAGTRKAMALACGRHMHILRHGDGTVTGLSNEFHLKFMPELEAVEKLAIGHSVQGALLEDGTVAIFGWIYKTRPPFPHADLLVDIDDLAVSVGGFYFKKRDGSFIAWTTYGKPITNKPEDLRRAKIVAMEGGLSSGCVMLTEKGKVIAWNGPEPPANLGKAKAIAVGTSMAAAQMEKDGSWVIWGGEESLRDELNTKLAELGPLKSLALGRAFFVVLQ